MMDLFYDVKAAETKVESIAKAQTFKAKQLQYFNATDGTKNNIQITFLERSKTWKLISTSDNQQPEEVVLRIQGVLCQKSLLPISQPPHIEAKQRFFMRQSATLTGLGGSAFDMAIKKVQEIHQIFSRNFPQDMLENWNPATFEGHLAIDINNRLFTLRKHAISEEIISFSDTLDPHGILAEAMGIDDQFVHSIENNVDYYELVCDQENEVKYEEITPIKFRCGDIIEAHISFLCIQMKSNKYRMLIVLRAITLLDTSPLREASVIRNKSKNQTVQQVSLKRKVGYSMDEVEEVKRRLNGMKLD